MAVHAEELAGMLTIQPIDIERAKHNFQWVANAAIASIPDTDFVWFLRQASGTGMSLIIGGVTVISGATSIDFHDDGIRLGHVAWSLTGTVNFAMGYRVRHK